MANLPRGGHRRGDAPNGLCRGYAIGEEPPLGLCGSSKPASLHHLGKPSRAGCSAQDEKLAFVLA